MSVHTACPFRVHIELYIQCSHRGRYNTKPCVCKDTHLLPLVLEVGEEVSIGHELSDEAERLLESDTTNHVHNVGVVAFRNLLHHVNLGQEICLLLASRCD